MIAIRALGERDDPASRATTTTVTSTCQRTGASRARTLIPDKGRIPLPKAPKALDAELGGGVLGLSPSFSSKVPSWYPPLMLAVRLATGESPNSINSCSLQTRFQPSCVHITKRGDRNLFIRPKRNQRMSWLVYEKVERSNQFYSEYQPGLIKSHITKAKRN